MTNTNKCMSIFFQKRNFLEIKKSNAKNHTGLGSGGIGVLLIALLIANALTQPPCARGLLKAPEECLLINYCNKFKHNSVHS